MRLQNHLLSSQGGVLVQNGPFPQVVSIPVHSRESEYQCTTTALVYDVQYVNGSWYKSPRHYNLPYAVVIQVFLSMASLSTHPPSWCSAPAPSALYWHSLGQDLTTPAITKSGQLSHFSLAIRSPISATPERCGGSQYKRDCSRCCRHNDNSGSVGRRHVISAPRVGPAGAAGAGRAAQGAPAPAVQQAEGAARASADAQPEVTFCTVACLPPTPPSPRWCSWRRYNRFQRAPTSGIDR